VSVRVRSIWRTWTPGSIEESTCVVRFPDPLFWLHGVLRIKPHNLHSCGQ
jgi:hypothetical protein